MLMAAVMFSSSRQVSRNCRVPLACFVKYKSKSPRVFQAPSVRGLSSCGYLRSARKCLMGVRNNAFQLRRLVVANRTIHVSACLGNDFVIVKTPGFPESISEGDVRWDKGVGDYVKEDESIGEIETDKTSIPVLAPASGYIEELMAGDGDTVVTDQSLVKLKVSGEAPAAETVAATAPATPQEVPTPPPAPAAATPPSVPPPVPELPTAPMSTVSTSSVKVTPLEPSATAAGGLRTEHRVKMNRMRQRIAQRLKEAQNTCAMLTTFNEIDMSNVMELRAKNKVEFEKQHGVKLGFMSAFIKASSYALQRQPVVNAVIDETEIVYRDYIDISVAVATPKGLVVPVLRNTENMNYAEIEKGLNELGEKAKKGDLAIEDMDGGTFTISNGGVFGSLFGTPIINPPQSAILGMHGIFDRPVAINGKVEVRPMMYIALTYDHRLIDGREAVTFLRTIKRTVEDPRVLLLDL